MLTANHPPAAAISTAQAVHVFTRATALCRAEGGRLWGVSLCVPMMLTDPATHQALTNRPVSGGKPDGRFFRLLLPPDAQIATAPFIYRGVRWAQIPLPMQGDAQMRAVILMHESFHVIQPRIGFNGNSDDGSISGDEYLDTQTGRVWLRGELHALRAALQSSGEARQRALRDAVAMRLYRHALLPESAESERRLDVLEGLAENTGIDAGLPPGDRMAYALRDIAFVEKQPSYARSFPYATGPAYGELLDAAETNWRRKVTRESDISAMAMHAYGLNVAAPTAAQAERIIAAYGGKAIEAEETARAARKTALDAQYIGELVKGPTLTLPLTKFHITFNPRDIETLNPYGSVYHTLAVTAPWGSITVTNGDALIGKDFRTLIVAAPFPSTGGAIRGKGWILHLSAQYGIVPDPRRTGSFGVSTLPHK